jgi:hypothetical protein
MTAHNGHRVVDLRSLGVVEFGDVAFDPVDQPPDSDDLLLGGSGVGAGPFVDPVDSRGQPFAGAQQVFQVGLQVGQEGDVGAEVVAAGAAVSDWAGAATGFDVGRFGADAERYGDLTDGAAGVLGVQQRLGLPPDAVAVAVETERGDGVDGGAAAVLADAVVAPGYREASVVEQLGQDVDRNPGVGVALGVAVPCVRKSRVRSGSCGV